MHLAQLNIARPKFPMDSIGMAEAEERLVHLREHGESDFAFAGFSQLSEQRVSFTVDLSDPQTRQGLLEMTPYYWRLPQDEAQARFAELQQVEADFVIHVWQREHS